MDLGLANHQSEIEVMELEKERRPVSPVARRALAEAEARRRAQAEAAKEAEIEVGGRDGPDPVRYGDWEKGGIVSDF
jgi:hypothetical protein